MKFIVDAQLPKGIVQILRDEGIDAIHTDDLPNKERTTDNEIMASVVFIASAICFLVNVKKKILPTTLPPDTT